MTDQTLSSRQNTQVDSQTHFTEHGQQVRMKLGVYERPELGSDSEVYTRLALYDFEEGEWDDTSSGVIVLKANRNPTPEELKVRFDLDKDARRTVVVTPERMDAENIEVEVVSDPAMTVEEGHQYREKTGGPVLTQTEAEYRDEQGVIVVEDGYTITDRDRELLEHEDQRFVHASDWDGMDFGEEFDIEFHTPE